MLKCTLFIFLLIPAMSFGQKSKFVGNYLYGSNRYNKSDTISGQLFITTDSFEFIYQVKIKHDSDYAYPLCRGTWDIGTDGKTVTLKYGTGQVRKGTFKLIHTRAYRMQLQLDGDIYTRQWPTHEE